MKEQHQGVDRRTFIQRMLVGLCGLVGLKAFGRLDVGKAGASLSDVPTGSVSDGASGSSTFEYDRASTVQVEYDDFGNAITTYYYG